MYTHTHTHARARMCARARALACVVNSVRARKQNCIS